jgi:hypothetical protein
MNLKDLLNLVNLFTETVGSEPTIAFIRCDEYDNLMKEVHEVKQFHDDYEIPYGGKVHSVNIRKCTSNETFLKNKTHWMNMNNNKIGKIYKP